MSSPICQGLALHTCQPGVNAPLLHQHAHCICATIAACCHDPLWNPAANPPSWPQVRLLLLLYLLLVWGQPGGASSWSAPAHCPPLSAVVAAAAAQAAAV